MTRDRGIGLLEVVLAISIALGMLMAGVFSFRQYKRQMLVDRSKLILEGVRGGVQMERYRTGSLPTLASMSMNVSVDAQPYFDLGREATLVSAQNPLGNRPLRDPLLDVAQVVAATTSWGGFIYAPSTGTFALNAMVRPGLGLDWLAGDDPSKW